MMAAFAVRPERPFQLSPETFDAPISLIVGRALPAPGFEFGKIGRRRRAGSQARMPGNGFLFQTFAGFRRGFEMRHASTGGSGDDDYNEREAV